MAARLHPVVASWFERTYRDFTEAQQRCVPAILKGHSVLLTSPTGSGKTLAGFLGIIDQLVRKLPLPEGTHAIYVSPLRALTYDIQKNLERPLREMGLLDEIRLGLRTGDTPAKERARLKRKPPHILLTTPESLAILLCQPSHHASLNTCRYVVVDELHSLAENKRGAHLSISLERLERLVTTTAPALAVPPALVLRRVEDAVEKMREDKLPAVPALRPAAIRTESPGAPGLCRIGLSATVSPLETMAEFLVGVGRPCLIAEARTQRQPIVEVFSPLRRHPYPPSGQSARHVLKELATLINSRRSVLIFTNTRSGAESFCFSLKASLPELADKIEVHHSSLDRDVRLAVEDRLKNGELRAAVCSTSLEMGVDIGAIDLVVMISTPKGVSRTIQRIGRSGHSINQISHGILVATNINDLVECVVTAQLVRERKLDEVQIPENSADVLAQHIMGLAMAEQGFPVDLAFQVIRQAAPFRSLARADFDRVLDYLEGGGRSLAKAYTDTFGKVRVVEERIFTVSTRAEREYLVNIGTIVTNGLVGVSLRRRKLGSVEEQFIRELKPGDIFVLAGKTVRFLGADWQTARVEDGGSERPNVPVWAGSRRPLATGLSEAIGKFRAELDDRLAADIASIPDWLVEQWDLSAANAQAIIAHFQLQRRHSRIPRPDIVLIERYRQTGRDPALSHYFVHSLIGRGANDALSRIAAWRLSQLVGGNAMVTLDDYGFLLTLRQRQELTHEQWRICLAPADAENDLRRSLVDSQLVRTQFRAVAQTGLMVPRHFPGQDRAPRQLRFSSELLFTVLGQHEADHPLLVEAYRQATTQVLNCEGAYQWMHRALNLEWDWKELPVVSPFGFGLFASKLKESMTFEDPAEAIEHLYQEFYGSEPLADWNPNGRLEAF